VASEDLERSGARRLTAFVALLRAVNVGGTGKLPMADLKRLCEQAGMLRVSTYIASGNVVFESPLLEPEVKARLGEALQSYAGRPLGVLVRTAAEMAAVVRANPFADKPPAKVSAIFLDAPPPTNALDEAIGATVEALALGLREIYVHYPDGQAETKLKIPAARTGTARNFNTVTKLAALAAAL